MRLMRLRLRHFRNHTDTTLEFGEGINAFFGDNGQGKTNVLEAISYLSLTKSFYAAGDRTVLQKGMERFEVEGTILTDSNVQHTIRVVYTGNGDKLFTVNGIRPETLTSVIGRFPLVVLSPENNAITFGGPAERRRFMDLLLSQISRTYLEDLLEYRRALKQRNRILMDARQGRGLLSELLDPWTETIVRLGARIIAQRARFFEEFRPRMQDTYKDLVAGGERHEADEHPDLEYVSLAGLNAACTPEDIRQLMHQELHRRAEEEIRRGTTLVGPHRDDIQLSLNGLPMQQYASQGQHKTMLIALKIAEYFYLRERCNELPIMLLDDVFSELDEHRARYLLRATGELGQTFITTTDERVFGSSVAWNGRHRRFYVHAGRVLTSQV